ncbi:MAG: amidohydrolase family protein [Nitrososphaerales archaeon]
MLNEYVKTQLPLSMRFIDSQVSHDVSFFVDPEVRLRAMDKYKIDIDVLTIAFQDAINIPKEDVSRITKVANESLAEVVNKHPDRLIGTATVLNPEGEGLDELDHAIRDLGMKGALIFSNVNGKPLDSPEFIPFYEKMVHYDLPIFIHPADWPYYSWVGEYRLDRILGWPFDTSLAMGRLVFGGVMRRFPNLKIIAHHLGGMIPHFSERIQVFVDQAESNPKWGATEMFQEQLKAKENIMESFKSFYGDTVIFGNKAALKCGLDFFGADHVVYATDYPFGAEEGEQNIKLNTKFVEELDIPETDKEKIFEKNARRLLKLN